MPARDASSASESSSARDQKKKKKKAEKKHKKDKKDISHKKVKKEKQEKHGTNRHAPKSESEDDAPAAPRLGPAVPSRTRQNDGARELRQRSRSRDEPPLRPPGGNPLDRLDDSKGSGKGKGKEKGQGKGGKGEEAVEKEEPNFEASGLLAMQDNSKNGIPLKFTMPPDSRMPDRKWRLYVFSKQNEAGKVLHVHRFAGYLFGKDRRVADVPTDHPTCSKQHAVLHYRVHSGTGEVRPYIMDLESTNGTHLNGERIEAARYHEVKEGDALKFGLSSREFVLLHSTSAHDQPIDPSRLMLD